MSYDLSDYVEVPERIVQFRDRYPEGTLQSELVPSPVEGFIVVKAYAYRTPDDPRPGVGWAWEPVPGKSNFTRDSELMNAETSAWGRALIAVGAADAKRGIASANEVLNRQQPDDTDWHAALRELLAKVPWPDDFDHDDEDLHQAAGIAAFFGGDVNTVSELSDAQAQKLATALSPTNTTSGADRRAKFAQFAIDAVSGDQSSDGTGSSGEGTTGPSDTPPEPSDGERLWVDVQGLWRKLAVQGPRVLTHARLIVSEDELDGAEGKVEWTSWNELGPDAHPQVLRGLKSWLEDQQAKAGAA